MKVLVIDNYDSFVYNLVQYLLELDAEVEVIRNDQWSAEDFVKQVNEQIKPSHILVSPGPGKPQNAGLSLVAIQEFKGKLPILGVCLGCQAIGELHGSPVVHAPQLMHGKTSKINIVAQHPLFQEIPQSYIATRYHSLVIDKESLARNPNLNLLATTDDGTVMAVCHKEYPNLVGVQYHPESILSEYGHKLLNNFLQLV